MKKSDIRITKAIKDTESFLEKAQHKIKYTDRGGLTIYGCEVRNLEVYKSILGVDKRTLKGWERELYQSI